MARAIALAFVVVVFAFAHAQAQNTTVHTISVSGYGNIQSLSDIAVVSVQVSSTQDLASDARANVSATVSNIIDALGRAYGSKETISVTTNSLNVYPQTQYNSMTGVSTRTGYQFQHTLSINVRNVTSQLLAGIIDVVVNQGSDISINSINFGLSSGIKNGLWLEGRNGAVADAKGTAQLYAKALGMGETSHFSPLEVLISALGVELGPIVSLQEVSGTTADMSSYSASDITGAPLVASAANGTFLAPTVSIGQQTVTIQVSAVYELLPPAPASAAALAASAGTAGR